MGFSAVDCTLRYIIKIVYDVTKVKKKNVIFLNFFTYVNSLIKYSIKESRDTMISVEV